MRLVLLLNFVLNAAVATGSSCSTGGQALSLGVLGPKEVKLVFSSNFPRLFGLDLNSLDGCEP